MASSFPQVGVSGISSVLHRVYGEEMCIPGFCDVSFWIRYIFVSCGPCFEGNNIFV
jgi:hypothetical protein